jgi:hypothetical protein
MRRGVAALRKDKRNQAGDCNKKKENMKTEASRIRASSAGLVLFFLFVLLSCVSSQEQNEAGIGLDDNGNLVFFDATTSTPVALSDLARVSELRAALSEISSLRSTILAAGASQAVSGRTMTYWLPAELHGTSAYSGPHSVGFVCCDPAWHVQLHTTACLGYSEHRRLQCHHSHHRSCHCQCPAHQCNIHITSSGRPYLERG